MQQTLWIALGGALGSVARYWIALWALPVSRHLPWGTIGINIAGSFLIGFFGTLTLEGGRHPAPEWARLFVMVGICGGFTTFSSFSLQTLDLLRSEVGSGVTVCIIEHNLDIVLSISDRIAFLDRGKLLADGDPATILKDPHLAAIYFGEQTEAAA